MPGPTRPARPLARRRGSGPGLAELVERMKALEERLARIEEGKPPPGDGRSSPRNPARQPPRCVGCGLPLRRKAGRCMWCGRPL